MTDDTKQKIFEAQKAEWLADGFTEDELIQCDRCYRVEPDSIIHKAHGQYYCECCYADCFVPWSEVFKNK